MALWDTANGALRSRLFGHLSGVESVAFSEDGERVASASWDTTAKLWDVRSGKLLTSLQGHIGAAWSVAFDREGRQLVTASQDWLARRWSVPLLPDTPSSPRDIEEWCAARSLCAGGRDAPAGTPCTSLRSVNPEHGWGSG